MRVERVAWKSVPWKSCLLEGLAEARAGARRGDRAPFAPERGMRYPGARMPDVPADPGEAEPPVAPAAAHAAGEACDGTPRVPAGTLVARLVGRALSADGKPVAD